MFGRATIRLGIGPHSSCQITLTTSYYQTVRQISHNQRKSAVMCKYFICDIQKILAKWIVLITVDADPAVFCVTVLQIVGTRSRISVSKIKKNAYWYVLKNSLKIFTIFQKMVEYSLNPPPYFVTTYCVTLIVVDVVSCLPVQCTFWGIQQVLYCIYLYFLFFPTDADVNCV